MWKYPETLKNAFPSELHEEIENIIRKATVDEDYEYEPLEPFRVYVEGEEIAIPERIYLGQNVSGLKSLSPLQQEIISCFFTRSYNGYVREEYLKHIITANQPWVVPFVIRLLGEYVIEILQVIYENFKKIDIQLYCKFIEENPMFYEITKQRVISYWDCYYRSQYKDKNDYVGFKIIETIENGCNK